MWWHLAMTKTNRRNRRHNSVRADGGVAALVLALVWLCALIGGGPAGEMDIWLSSRLYLGEGAAAVPFWAAVTELGGWVVLLGISVVAALNLLIKGRTRDAVFLLGVVIGVRLLVEGQKLLFARERPDIAHLADVASLSFPSGHSANALATYVTLGIVFSASRPVMLLLAVLVGLIGLSRVLLGVHWPSDVLGGWALAGLCLILATRLRDGPERQE